MTGKLTIVAKIIAKKDRVELVKSELLKLVEPTRGEEGCLQYDLHQDRENPEIFLFFENWENHDLWQKHMANENLKAFGIATEGAVEEMIVNEMVKID